VATSTMVPVVDPPRDFYFANTPFDRCNYIFAPTTLVPRRVSFARQGVGDGVEPITGPIRDEDNRLTGLTRGHRRDIAATPE
jgi:hypothetical protein